MLIQIKEINQQNITDILYGKPCFYSLGCIFDEKIINYWKQNILKEKLGHYHNAPLIAKIGMAYYETIHNEKLKKEYFENAKYWNDILRNACFPYISPIDYIISLFDITWNKGCKRAVFNNRKTFAGLVRVLTENSSIEPHQDIFKRDDEITWNDNGQIKEQIAFNFFLDNAEDGGEMELWNWKPNDDEYRKFQHTNIKLNYGLDRSKISLPYTTYKPKLGEIVLFNPRYVHAVKKVNKGIRLTISCFLGVNENEELVVWS